MNVNTIGILKIYYTPRGVNKDTLATKVKKGVLEFTKNAIKAFNKEKDRRSYLLIPITDIAFKENGVSAGGFQRWIASLVTQEIGNSKKENYEVDDYQTIRNQLK
jgi:hypothetical protein